MANEVRRVDNARLQPAEIKNPYVLRVSPMHQRFVPADVISDPRLNLHLENAALQNHEWTEYLEQLRCHSWDRSNISPLLEGYVIFGAVHVIGPGPSVNYRLRQGRIDAWEQLEHLGTGGVDIHSQTRA